MEHGFDVQSCRKWRTVVAGNVEEVEAVRGIWEQMQRNERVPAINADVDRYLAVLESMKDTVRPCIILLYEDDSPKAMVIGRIEGRRVTSRLGYTTILNPSMSCLSVVYGGILGRPSEQTSAKLLLEIMGILKRGDVDAVFFNQLRLDSAFYRLAKTMPNPLCRCYRPVVKPHWQTHLPDSIEAFYGNNSGARKRYVRRYTRALEKACSGPVETVCYRSEDKLNYVIDVASDISSRTYKHALNVGFRDDNLTRSLLSQAAKRQSLRAYVLYAGGKPCAFEFGVEYGTVFFPEHIGYDPLLSACSPGTVLFIKVLEDLIQNSGVRVFDYGFGGAAYKERFGTESWPEASVYIFAPRLYPICINAARSFVRGVNQSLGYVAHKIGSIGWIKRRWRNVLEKSSGN